MSSYIKDCYSINKIRISIQNIVKTSHPYICKIQIDITNIYLAHYVLAFVLKYNNTV